MNNFFLLMMSLYIWGKNNLVKQLVTKSSLIDKKTNQTWACNLVWWWGPPLSMFHMQKHATS